MVTSPAATFPSPSRTTDFVSLLIDLFGYLSIVIHGLTITAQSVALGSVLFLALLLRPMVAQLGAAGQGTERTCTAIAAWSALALVLCEATTVALQTAVLVGTVDITVADTLRAGFAVAGLVKTTAAALIALTLFGLGPRAPMAPLLVLAAIELAAATLTTHAAARLDHRTLCCWWGSCTSSARRSGSAASRASWSRWGGCRTRNRGG